MGRLMDRLKVRCRNCNHKHIPRRMSGKYHDDGKRVSLWECKECKHIWIDSVFKTRDK